MSELRLSRLLTFPSISLRASSDMTGLSWALLADRTACRKSLSSRVRPFTNLQQCKDIVILCDIL